LETDLQAAVRPWAALAEPIAVPPNTSVSLPVLAVKQQGAVSRR
jgi:hypothetical protein